MKGGKWFVSSLAASGLLLVGLLLLNRTTQVVRADPDNLFVIPGGGGDCSQGNPCGLQAALISASDGDAIYLGGGTYTGSGGAVITVTDSIMIHGGWDGASSGAPACNPDTFPTTVDGESARRGVVVNGGVTVTLEGFAVANGMATDQGAGLYAHDAALTLRAMAFYSNVIDIFDTPDTYAYGGGAYVEGGTLRVEASTFQANSAWAQKSSSGGGLAISHALSATIEGCLFLENDAWHASGLSFLGDGDGTPFTLRDSTFLDNGLGRSAGRASGGYVGALEVANAQAHIEGNTFSGSMAANDYGAVGVFYSGLVFERNVVYDNKCARTSGLYLSGVSPFTVTNNIIAENISTYNWLQNPAVMVLGGDGRFLHNTIARNESSYGVQVDSSANAILTNTILVSHTVGISVTAGSTATLEGTMWGSGPWGNGTDYGGAGSISSGAVQIWGDPAFADPDGGDYHIGPDSAALDAGVDAGLTIDIDGEPRPARSSYDIGADECFEYLYLPLVVRNLP